MEIIDEHLALILVSFYFAGQPTVCYRKLDD